MNKEERLRLLKQKSPYALPDNPSMSGWTTAQVKQKFYQGLFLLNDFIEEKQDKLSFDSVPTESSDNPVTSKGIKAYVDANSGANIQKVTVGGVQQPLVNKTIQLPAYPTKESLGVEEIEKIIPEEASQDNKLVDQNYLNTHNIGGFSFEEIDIGEEN